MYYDSAGRGVMQLGDERNDVAHEIGNIGKVYYVAGFVRVYPPIGSNSSISDLGFVARP